MSTTRTVRARRRRAIAALALLATAAAAAVGVLQADGGGGETRSAAMAFLERWSGGDDARAAQLTDNPREAVAQLAANRKGLDGARLHARLVSLDVHGNSAHAVFELRWEVPVIGGWQYRSQAQLTHVHGRWLVRWAPSLVHPRLDRYTRLGTTREAAERGEILDRAGHALVAARPVVQVGLARNAVGDLAASSQEMAAVLHIDAGSFERALRGAGTQQFVPAITLRSADYRRIAGRLAGIRGLELVRSRQPLAITRDFARALLGGVGAPTAEQVKRLGADYNGATAVGQWGLEAAFDRTLAGKPGASIVIRSRGVPIETLVSRHGQPGQALRTTLDARVQQAAERALGPSTAASALVAVQPSSGDILAVANRPTESTYDRALAGQYPPGSTFKVIDAAALLQRGVTPGTPVACPKTLTVGGKLFKNFEGEAGGQATFAEDFAKSCNTAFVSLAPRVPARVLTEEAALFGLGRPFHLPVEAAPSRVPVPANDVEHAATMIGQARVIASPLALAGVAATVADGRWHAPRLLGSDPRRAGPALPSGDLAHLRSLMRGVVTSGTGTALASAPGTISGKTGTAEFGGGPSPPTHAWFIAFRGSEIAVAVLVENGPSGGATAAPIAARFFDALARG